MMQEQSDYLIVDVRRPDEFEAARRNHEEMGCIVFENHEMGIYFITDPDGYWLEVIPEKEGGWK